MVMSIFLTIFPLRPELLEVADAEVEAVEPVASNENNENIQLKG